MYLVIIAAFIPTLKPVSLATFKFPSSKGTGSGFSWRRLLKSRSSTDRSNTENKHKLPKQPQTPSANKQPCDIHTTMLRCEDDRFVRGATPKNGMELEGIHKTTEFAVQYSHEYRMREQSQVKAQREFEMV
ncbi:hypothetical protein DSL72_007357 [Monilinia vaccinii-corymbosi]|uniref:Uncharacterized protein n=1 Tax=Monilinia vaccinii-corymbosi TaxID=61207 RepID=A0A8A3PMW9_9HELO|nr:hypothetical protein DSL72_007357 [Monilinia vaccinii-corymbosi]